MKQELFECCVQNLHIFLLKRPELPKTFRGVWVEKSVEKVFNYSVTYGGWQSVFTDKFGLKEGKVSLNPS
jgi:hypothetical protein